MSIFNRATVVHAIRLSNKYSCGVEFDCDNSRIIFSTHNQEVLAEINEKMRLLTSLITLCEEKAVQIEDS